MKNDRHNQFISQLEQKIGRDDQIVSAIEYATRLPHTDKSIPRSIDVAARVLEMGSDRDTIIAALLSDPELRESLPGESIEKEFGPNIAKLTQGVNQLNTLKEGSQARIDTHAHG